MGLIFFCCHNTGAHQSSIFDYESPINILKLYQREYRRCWLWWSSNMQWRIKQACFHFQRQLVIFRLLFLHIVFGWKLDLSQQWRFWNPLIEICSVSSPQIRPVTENINQHVCDINLMVNVLVKWSSMQVTSLSLLCSVCALRQAAEGSRKMAECDIKMYLIFSYRAECFISVFQFGIVFTCWGHLRVWCILHRLAKSWPWHLIS